MKAPTDLRILNFIYEMYYDDFVAYNRDNPARRDMIYVPIEISQVARRLGVNGNLIFGRLYYHLEQKYGYQRADGSLVFFFALNLDNEMHCINFPYLASVVATLREERRRFSYNLALSLFALLISFISLAISATRVYGADCNNFRTQSTSTNMVEAPVSKDVTCNDSQVEFFSIPH